MSKITIPKMLYLDELYETLKDFFSWLTSRPTTEDTVVESDPEQIMLRRVERFRNH